MDILKDLLEVISPLIKSVLEEKLETKFSLGKIKTIETNKIISDVCFNFELIKNNQKQNVFYFTDRKIMLNLIRVFSEQLNNLDFNTDFLLSVIQEFNTFLLEQKLNNLIIRKKSIDKNDDYQLLKTSIIKGHEAKIAEDNIIFKACFLSSNKGDLVIAIPSENYKKQEKEPEKKYSKSYDIKEQTKSVLSTVQLIEMKKNILSSISEIKDLKGDGDFLLRKAKTINDLTKTWFEINKEED